MMPARLVLFIELKKYYNEYITFLRSSKQYEKNEFNH